MGNTLNTASKWTSAASEGKGILEITSINEMLLSKIAKFVLNFENDHPSESSLSFYQALKWNTTVNINAILKTLIKKDENFYELDRYDKNNQSYLTVKILQNGEILEVKAYNFQALAAILQLARKTELWEVKTCIESNPDPLNSILGPQFNVEYQNDADSPISKYLQYAICTQEKTGQKDTFTNKHKFLAFVMILKEFDIYLMKEALSFMASEIKITPREVDNQFYALVNLIEIIKDYPILKSINWLSPFTYVFENGCRAPLWRQLHGDISYIVATTVDNTNIFITANASGFFINKRDGFLNNNDSDFQRSGPIFHSLILLLKYYSDYFYRNIGRAMVNSQLLGYQGKGAGLKDMAKNEERIEPVKENLLIEPKCDPEEEPCPESQQIADRLPVQNADSLEGETMQLHKKDTGKKGLKLPKKRCGSIISLRNKELENWLDECSTEESDPDDDSERDGPQEKTIYNYNVKPRDPKFAGYWHIQNMFQFIKTGGHAPTLIGLCSLLDLNLTQENVAISIVEANGVEVLVNILELNDFECQMASLKILIEISRYQPIWQCIINFGGIEILIDLLNNTNIPIRCLAAECLGAVAKTAKARQRIRQENGIYKLVSFLDTFVSRKDYILGNSQKFYPSLPPKQLAKLTSGPIVNFLNKQWKRSTELAKSGAIVLAVLSNSRRTRKAMQICNVLPYLSRHLKSTDIVFLQSIVKIISEFAKEQLYRSSILSENMIPYLVHALHYNNAMLSERVCRVIYRASEDERIRHEIFKEKGLTLLKKILDSCSLDDVNTLPIIKAVTGAISKLLLSPENVKVFSKLGIIEALVPMMKSKSIKILLNVLSAFIEILKVPANRLEFNKNQGLHALLSLQSKTIPSVLIMVNNAIAQCAEEPSLINIIIENDGVRLLWSLLNHLNDEVKASAAGAICPCIKTAKDSGYMVRSLVGGLEMLVKLLKSNNVNVLASVCATIANVVQDQENIGILTEFKVCYLLSKILCAQNQPNINKLRTNLSIAIAQCSRFGNNREVFGKEDVVVHLVKYLSTNDIEIQKAASQALYQLSLEPDNIIRMHAEGCVKPLLKLIGSSDEMLQEAASQCISNIRNLAFANKMAKSTKAVAYKN